MMPYYQGASITNRVYKEWPSVAVRVELQAKQKNKNLA